MTELKKPVRRVSIANGVNRKRFVITLAPGDVVGFRDVRTRKTFWTSLACCYQLAVKQTVASERAERAAAKKAGRA
jgi:hypothetical protein